MGAGIPLDEFSNPLSTPYLFLYGHFGNSGIWAINVSWVLEHMFFILVLLENLQPLATISKKSDCYTCILVKHAFHSIEWFSLLHIHPPTSNSFNYITYLQWMCEFIQFHRYFMFVLALIHFFFSTELCWNANYV